MSKKKKQVPVESVESVENLLSKTEAYIEENQKSLTIILVVIAAVVLGYLGFRNFYVAPLEKEAISQVYVAERYFETDSFRLALEGDGLFPGFLEIIEDYGLTKTANLAQYYAGICYLNLGEYESAIEHLKNFHGRDRMVSTIALGAIGDAYVQLGDLNRAAESYMRAATKKPDDFTSPVYLQKAGQIYEETGNFRKAIQAYETIEDKYPESNEGRQVDKYLTRAKLLLGS
jgi:tetratricopeptide (TPR) repeat protein